jgi:hypothetical protein
VVAEAALKKGGADPAVRQVGAVTNGCLSAAEADLISRPSSLDYLAAAWAGEAQNYALMLAGLGLIGWRARRRG